MRPAEELQKEIDTLRERLFRFSTAGVRINESLDVSVVLREVVESARVLTGAGYGGVTTLDDDGQMLEFVGSGFSDEEYEQLMSLPEGQGVFEYLSAAPGPLRTPDLSEHVRSRGFPGGALLMKTYLGTPVRHGNRHVAHFYLGEKEDGLEFTDEDEEVLAMFACQAATAIANARRHRNEQRAREDLETLIDTCPVGVVVFDARSGAPVSYNREAGRIVEGLLTEDDAPERVLDVLTVRRADGREVSLDEMSLAEALRPAETVRAEEVVLEVPDGRSVTILINATPMRLDGGEVESMIVTLQDMSTREELERLRAEFLGMVSHELRAPLTSIKGSAATLIGSGESLDPTELLQFHRIIEQQADHMQDMIKDLLDIARIETGTLSVAPEPADAAALVDQARSAFLMAGGCNDLDISLDPDLPPVMADRRRVAQVLSNLVSNAARYSLATSAIRLAAVREGVHVAFSVAGDGIGMSAELMPYLFRKHSRVDGDDRSGLAGSGLGLAICKGIVEAHGGRIWAESDGPGMGARFTFTLPAVDQGRHTVADGPVLTSIRSRRMGRIRTRVLAVDSDQQTLRYVRQALAEAGYTPIVTTDPEEVGRLVEDEKPQLVLLDVMLPETDRTALIKNMPELADVPLILLSGYGRDQIVAKALEAGADDYIVKPFSPTELVARIETVLRRRTPPGPSEPEPYQLGDLSIDYSHRQVTVAGHPIRLTNTEYRLLTELSVNAGRVLSHHQLLQRVWGPQRSVSTGQVRTVVKNLRRKLGDNADEPAYIFTEQRVGYRMQKGATHEQR